MIDQDKSEIRLLIVDDHQLFLDGLKLLLDLKKGINVRQMALGAEIALEILENEQVDVVLTDINMPGMDGIDLIKLISSKHQGVKVIALTMLSDLSTVQSALDAGACGYLLKNSTGKELSDAIHYVAEGKVYISAEINSRLSMGARPRLMHQQLSDREREVLSWIAQGKSSKQIATELSLSVDTIKFHRKNLLSKLHQPNSTALVRYAIENGLV